MKPRPSYGQNISSHGFYVGQRVRRLASGLAGGPKAGQLGTITRISGNVARVRFDEPVGAGHTWGCGQKFLEPAPGAEGAPAQPAQEG